MHKCVERYSLSRHKTRQFPKSLIIVFDKSQRTLYIVKIDLQLTDPSAVAIRKASNIR